MKVKLPVKIFDIVVILFAAGLTFFSTVAAYVNPAHSTRVLIEGMNQQWIFPLDAEETVKVKGPLGETVIRIHENEVWVDSSPCDNQTCVGMGHVTSAGDWVACLPNNVYFLIEGNDDSTDSLDGAAW